MLPRISTWRPLAVLGVFVAVSLSATTTVTIVADDTLSGLAADHGVTVDELVSWNDIDDPDRIFIGDTLVVSPPPAAPDDAAVGAPAGDRYTVMAGDTLSSLARRFGSTVARLAAANGLADPDRIVIGQHLVVAPDTAPPSTTTEAVPAAASTYTVLEGDTLGLIAARHGVKTGVLAAANDIDDPDRIFIGQVLAIGAPAAEAPAPAPEPPPPPTTSTPPAATTTVVPPPAASTPPAPTTTAPSRRGEVVLTTLFTRWADAYDVPRDLLEAIAWKESDWRHDAVGPNGHLGITQLSPDTVEFIESGLLGREMDPLAASDGLQMAARYLRYVLDRTHTEREAVAAWQQGLRSVQNDGVSATGGAYADAVLEIRRQRS